VQRKYSPSHVAYKFKTKPQAGKLILVISWDSQGHILETYLEHGTTVTGSAYSDMPEWTEAYSIL
jgi:hypothetical protein